MRNLRRNTFLAFTTVLIIIIIWRSRNNTNQLSETGSYIYNNESTDDDRDGSESSSIFTDNFHDEDRYEKWINNYMNNIVPGLGDRGEPAYLESSEEHDAIQIFKQKGINVILSNKISLERRLHDERYLECRSNAYDIEHLPSTSVVIIFYNEPWSVLLRTVHSVLRETPEKLLKQIILVDDSSDEEELKGKLTHYVKTRFPRKVELMRLSKRQGIIRARLEGAKHASGDVIVFLDAHCEVIKEWLEPMLTRIKEKRNAVVTPLVDTISDRTLAYQPEVDTTIIGGFTWSGNFMWVDIPKRLIRKLEFPRAPISTPTMVGGIFAIDREYFWEFGSYDEKMDGWGGENLEMSFRTWQCGGSIEVIPCSRVGHIFREFLPYKLPNNKDTQLFNVARAVNVWMDNYTRLFYFHNNNIEFGDIQDRLEIRQKLKCKSFKWYLENVYPEKFIPDENVTAYGRVRLTTGNLCLDIARFDETDPYKLKVDLCKDKLTYMQYFSLTNKGQLRTELRCASVLRDGLKVEMNECERLFESEKWTYYEDGSLVNFPSRLCLDAGDLSPGQDVVANSCDGSLGQTWDFEYYPNYISQPL